MGASTSSNSTMRAQGNYMVEERDDNYIILHPKETVEHKYSIVWLHGLGDSANGFSDVFLDHRIGLVPATCKVILPTAPMRQVTCNMGMTMTSWYDIKTLDRPKTMTIDAMLDNYGQDEIRESVDIVTKLIDAEVEKLGSSEKVFLGGFS